MGSNTGAQPKGIYNYSVANGKHKVYWWPVESNEIVSYHNMDKMGNYNYELTR